jgi:hypothetical protein
MKRYPQKRGYLREEEDMWSLYSKTTVHGIVSTVLTRHLHVKQLFLFEISSSHGSEYDIQSCLLGYTAV